ncbi:hypothetical protein HMPREF1982_02632 [Clostridiales bacterium oral taxon 876 str. F0540]|nr:hypothetical protein HMPREF1982_02632 [Clostridiales bacterium oral taxon 876 str. F0540]
MKKAKVLTAALVAGLLTMGAGYAAWTDNLNITNVIQTGELAATFTSASASGDAYVTANASAIAPTGRTNSINFTIQNLYPGAGATLNASFKNDGTIPAKIGSVVVTYNPLNETAPNGFTAISQADYSKIKVSGNVTVYKADRTKVVKSVDTTLAGLQSALNTQLSGVQLEPAQGSTPAEYVSFENLKVSLDSATGTVQKPNELEKSWIKFKVDFNLVQHN